MFNKLILQNSYKTLKLFLNMLFEFSYKLKHVIKSNLLLIKIHLLNKKNNFKKFYDSNKNIICDTQIVLRFIRFWNKNIFTLKTNSIKQCSVNIINDIRCKNLTQDRYCREHMTLRPLECSMYHYINYFYNYYMDDNRLFYNSRPLIALVEFEQRKNYVHKYLVNVNSSHSLSHNYWLNCLRSYFISLYYIDKNNIIKNNNQSSSEEMYV